MDVVACDDVVVVKHEHERLAPRVQLVEKLRQDALDDFGPRRPQQEKRGLTQASADRLKGNNQVGPEPNGIVVGLLKRKPTEMRGVGGAPLREQRRLAPAGTSFDKRQSRRVRCQLPDQLAAFEELRAQRRRVQLRREQNRPARGATCGPLRHAQTTLQPQRSSVYALNRGPTLLAFIKAAWLGAPTSPTGRGNEGANVACFGGYVDERSESGHLRGLRE